MAATGQIRPLATGQILGSSHGPNLKSSVIGIFCRPKLPNHPATMPGTKRPRSRNGGAANCRGRVDDRGVGPPGQAAQPRYFSGLQSRRPTMTLHWSSPRAGFYPAQNRGAAQSRAGLLKRPCRSPTRRRRPGRPHAQNRRRPRGPALVVVLTLGRDRRVSSPADQSARPRRRRPCHVAFREGARRTQGSGME